MMGRGRYRICTKCVMDTNDPEINFDSEGVCNHCRSFEASHVKRPPVYKRQHQLELLISQMRASGRNGDYDCVIGMSGGVDSSYLAHLAVELNLRPLAVHVDAGWNSELAVRNVEVLVKNLNIDLFTFVVDWEEMRDLQVAFLRSGVANQDIPQDHAFAAAVLRVASDRKIRWILTGANWATESILPTAWGHNARDLRHLKAISRRFGKLRLRKYPTLSFFQRHVYYPYVRRIRKVKLLNHIDYNKAAAMEVLKREHGWRYYGGKHYESRYTKFFQGYYLPVKFGFDKRRAHLSSLVVSGQMTRDQAISELKKELYPAEQLKEDRAYVIKKLGLTEAEFSAIEKGPNRSYCDYPSNESLLRLKENVKALLTR